MKTEYRMLEEGEVIEKGDEIALGGNSWMSVDRAIGKIVSSASEIRRPIALTSTPTVLAEQLEKEQGELWQQNELNRWADTYSTWYAVTQNENLIVGKPTILTENNWQERRRIRMEAGLISDDEYDISQHSAEEVAELPEEPEAWESPNEIMPQVDFEVICCCDDDVFMALYREVDGNGWFEDSAGNQIDVHYWQDKPEPKYTPESPEQKAERERIEMEESATAQIMNAVGHDRAMSEDDVSCIVNHLIDTGAGYRLTKREAASDEQ